MKQELKSNVLYYQYDLNDLYNIKNIFEFCKDNNIKLDGLVHCAGVVENIPIKVNNIDIMENIMKVNCFSFVELGKYFSNRKYSNGNASIVAISSMASILNYKGIGQYSASKSALNSIVITMSKEFIIRKIRVNAILPAMVRTPMFEESELCIERFEEKTIKNQPLGVIDVENISYLVEFLLSNKSKYITGELISVSAGLF